MRGFTMAEALVGLAISGVVVGALLFAFSGGTRTVSKGMEALDALTATALSLEHLRQDLRALAGPLPAPTPRKTGEWTLELLRLDSVEPLSGRGLYLPVRWELTHENGRSVLERHVEGNELAFPFDGEVALEITADADPRAIRVRYTYPGPSGPRRPALTTVLLRQDSGAAVKLIGGVPRIPRARLLPELDAPWRIGATPAGAIYPAELETRPGR